MDKSRLHKHPFIVFTLPRSRSAWLAHFLSYGQCQVGHDIGISCASMEDFFSQFCSGMTGTVETGTIIAWKVIRHYIPKCRFVVIRRNQNEVNASLARHGIYGPEIIAMRDLMLEEVASLPGTRTYDYAELDDPTAIRDLFEFTTRMEFDPDWWIRLARVNIQVDMEQRLGQLRINHSRLERLKESVYLAQAAIPEIELSRGMH